MIFPTLLCLACQPEKKVEEQEFLATSADFSREMATASPVSDSSFRLDLWAPGPLLANAVAIAVDDQENVFVSQTSRRKSSYLDIREHWDWMLADLSLRSAADKRRFYLKTLAKGRDSLNQWLEDFNGDGNRDYRDLSVQKESIRRIHDEDGDGRADKARNHAEGFNDLLGGVAGGVLAFDGKVYVTANPSLWVVTNPKNNKKASRIKALVTGFGTHVGFAGHDLSGLVVGVDGRIYWSIGDHGIDVRDANGRRWHYPHEGGVMRCNPDGSGFEVFAHGLRNTHELAFDAFGNLISVDNDGDHPGENERYVHLLEGSDSGWRLNWQYGKYQNPQEKYKVWMDEGLSLPHFPGQAAYILPPLALAYDGPAGLKYQPGTALGEVWSNHFFASYFTGSSANSIIQAFSLIPRGASFALGTTTTIAGGIVPTGIAFSPRGNLLINDWKDSYDKKPAGRIWSLDVTKGKHPLREQTRQWLWEGTRNSRHADLLHRLSYPDQRIRMAAQFELVRRGESRHLIAQAMESKEPLLGRLHSIWGLGQLGRKNVSLMAGLLPLLGDTAMQVRAQTAKVLGEAGYRPASNKLRSLLADSDPYVRYRAAEALGKVGHAEDLPFLVRALARTKDRDPHLRHAIVFSMGRLATAQSIAALHRHPSREVRLGATVALRQQRSPYLAKFLGDSDTLVRIEAARGIHDDGSIPAALPTLAASLQPTAIQNQAFLRRAVNANLRLGTRDGAQRLVAFIRDAKRRENLRCDALQALGYWPLPPQLDRVDNSFIRRPKVRHRLEDAWKAFRPLFADSREGMSLPLQWAIVKAAGRLRFLEGEPELAAIFSDVTKNRYLRQEALHALFSLQGKALPEIIGRALRDRESNLREIALARLPETNLSPSRKAAFLGAFIASATVGIPEKQKALSALASVHHPLAWEILKSRLQDLERGKLHPALHLDILLALEKSGAPELLSRLKKYQKSLGDEDLNTYAATLQGGNPAAGRVLFAENEAAQCLRCHILGGKGGVVGPALDGIAERLSSEDMLLSLIQPNARLAPGYGVVLLTLKNGEELSGVLVADDRKNLLVRIGESQMRQIAKTTIQVTEMLPSGMFNMREILDKAQLRDLLAYLGTLHADTSP